MSPFSPSSSFSQISIFLKRSHPILKSIVDLPFTFLQLIQKIFNVKQKKIFGWFTRNPFWATKERVNFNYALYYFYCCSRVGLIRLLLRDSTPKQSKQFWIMVNLTHDQERGNNKQIADGRKAKRWTNKKFDWTVTIKRTQWKCWSHFLATFRVLIGHHSCPQCL